jgi:hypothetical protein
MKSAVIFPIRTDSVIGYCWTWRSVDGESIAQKRFPYYYDCLIDAQAKGYLVRLADARAENDTGRASLPVSFR